MSSPQPCGKKYKKYEKFAKLFEVLSNPIRIGVVISLAERPKKPVEIRKELGVPQPLLSQHVTILREMGIVEKVNKFNTKSACRLKERSVLKILKAAGVELPNLEQAQSEQGEND